MYVYFINHHVPKPALLTEPPRYNSCFVHHPPPSFEYQRICKTSKGNQHNKKRTLTPAERERASRNTTSINNTSLSESDRTIYMYVCADVTNTPPRLPHHVQLGCCSEAVFVVVVETYVAAVQ